MVKDLFSQSKSPNKYCQAQIQAHLKVDAATAGHWVSLLTPEQITLINQTLATQFIETIPTKNPL
jgi:hypothetical protein